MRKLFIFATGRIKGRTINPMSERIENNGFSKDQHRVLPVKQDRVSSNFRAVPHGTPEDITDICVYRKF